MTLSQYTTREEATTTFTDVWRWVKALEQLHARIVPHFAQSEPRRRALVYLQGLLSSIERKNGCKHAREANPLRHAALAFSGSLNADLVRDDLCRYVTDHLGQESAILVIDETSFPKRGRKSADVQIQIQWNNRASRELEGWEAF